jgi:hypothetical protein
MEKLYRITPLEKKSIEYELERNGSVNNYKLNRAIDLHFLIVAGQEFLK